MSTYAPPYDYSGRSSGSDYNIGLPTNTPTPGTMLRGVVDYKESYEGMPANYYDYTSNRSTRSICSCCSEEGDDDVFYERPDPFRVRGLTPDPKALQRLVISPYRPPSSTMYPIRYPRSPDDSRNTGSRGLSGYSTESFSDDFTDESLHANESLPANEASSYHLTANELSSYYSPANETSSYYSDHVSRTTLPSWPNTRLPVDPKTRKPSYLSAFDKQDPPWDMQTRHSEGGYRPPHRFRNQY